MKAAVDIPLDIAASAPSSRPRAGQPTSVRVRYRVPQDQARHLPQRQRAPGLLPPNAPLPRQGELVYLSSSSAWGVELVVHEWRSPVDLHIEVWLTHVGAAHALRPTGFSLTQ